MERREGPNGLVAVAIDKDKNSQNALKWTTDHLAQKGHTIILIHVKLKPPSSTSPPPPPPQWINEVADISNAHLAKSDPDPQIKEVFLPYRCFCTRKDIHCVDMVVEGMDIAKALIEYVSNLAIENLVVGASSKTGFMMRMFKQADIPSSITKGVPDFCNVFVISKMKVQSTRSATRRAPVNFPLRAQLLRLATNLCDSSEQHHPSARIIRGVEKPPLETPRKSQDKTDFFRSPFTRKGYNAKSYGEFPLPETDISFVSSGRKSVDQMFPSLYDNLDMGGTPQRISCSTETDTDHNLEAMMLGRRSVDINFSPEIYSFSSEGERLSTASSAMGEMEAEMRRLKLELRQTMEMYNNACKEALRATKRATELQHWKSEEGRKIEEAQLAEMNALAVTEKEKAKAKAAGEAAAAAKKIAELEARKRIDAEKKALKEREEKKKVLDALVQTDARYRKYSIEEIESATEFFLESRKIGEGGYGPVYKCILDHTPVAVKVLRPDAVEGRSQFHQEVEVLSCIRHPNMVLLLGACPEYGCLVYEFMANGSLEDRLFHPRNKPQLPWQLRFRIAAEIATGLLFLHQTKPEPLVHRDLKPANILLDCNYVSKISDVGLARLVPPSVADSVTQYRLTSTAGTFCYIDPEYQQTGMLGVKSDIYSLGIMFLQLITGRGPMGLTHHVGMAIEKGTFSDMLDPAIPDWPVEHALSFAKISLKCAELRRKDRPDLGKEVLPELNRLRALAEETVSPTLTCGGASPMLNHSQVSVQLEEIGNSFPQPSCRSSPIAPSTPE